MFEPSSRYANCEDSKIVTGHDQTIITYKRRRFLPQAEKMTIIQEVTVTAGERLDSIAAKVLGDAEQYWRICDANNAMYPEELVSEAGKVLKVAVPW